MTRLSRHTLVVLLVAFVACLGGMAIAVVAFGQSGGDPDAGVPTGDFTGTTPAVVTTAQTPTTSTSTLGSYTTTTPTQTTPTVTTNTTSTQPVNSQGNKGSSGTGAAPSTSHPAPSRPAPSVPSSRATRPGPTHLAFTGGEPILIGAGGMGLMLAGCAMLLARRRRFRLPAA